MPVTTQPQLIPNPERGEHSCSSSPHCCILGGRAQAPSLVQGLRPRNAPLWLPTLLVLSHHRGMPTVRPNQPGGCQPNAPTQGPNDGEGEELVKTDTVYGLAVSNDYQDPN